jgi:putative Mn2+ efflux pump MntP
MHLFELLFIALALSMDAFAVAMCAGVSMAKISVKKALIIGLYFGGFQAGMPLIGYFAATLLAVRAFGYAPWIAFALLFILGGKMIWGAGRDAPGTPPESRGVNSVAPAVILPLAIATSIDALAAGASFALLQVRIIPAVSLIGAITFAVSLLGVKIGSVFGAALKSKAEFTGGVILILIGVKILLEHLGII